MTPRSSIVAVSATMRRRHLVAWALVLLLISGLVGATLVLGDAGISPTDAVRALLGGGDASTALVVREWRLPRALLGVLVGAMLALAGALFQIITRNPLGSPDILGFSSGAFTGVLVVTAAGAVGYLSLTVSAFVGGIATAVVVLGLTARYGAHGFALVITGIGVTAMVGAVNTVLLVRMDDVVARSAAIWATGSLNGVGAEWVLPATAALLVSGGLVAALAPALALHELGDERSSALGAPPGRLRWWAMAIGVGLVAVCTAVAGPIAFVALAAPQIARRAWRSGPIPLAASAAVGAVLLLGSDLLAARLFAPTILPTGLVTLCLGGAYLAWLLATRERSAE